jgi:glutaredoxin
MAQSKWPEVKEKLIQVEAWCRDGLIDEQIANNLGISIDTFYRYKKEHSEFSESLKRGKEVVDIEVENKLLKRALGYSYNEKTFEKIWNDKLGKYITVNTKTVVKEVQPDTTAQIFWLKNRKPAEWRDKHEQEVEITGLPQIIIKRGDKVGN